MQPRTKMCIDPPFMKLLRRDNFWTKEMSAEEIYIYVKNVLEIASGQVILPKKEISYLPID